MSSPITTPFIARRELYWQSLDISKETYSKAILIDGPNGREAGVGIFYGRTLRAILTTEDALRVANQIADALQNPLDRNKP